MKNNSAAIQPTTAKGANLVKDARYQDIARRLIAGESTHEVAVAHGLTDRRTRQILGEPEMQATYEKAKEEIYGQVDEIIKDEKAAPILRAQAQEIRGRTLLGEVMEKASEVVTAPGTDTNAAQIRAATGAAIAAIDRGPSARRQEGKDQRHVHVHWEPTPEQAKIIEETIREIAATPDDDEPGEVRVLESVKNAS